MRRRLIVYDDFYPDPEVIRHAAVRARYTQPSDVTGYRSKPWIPVGCRPRFERILNCRITGWSTRGDRYYDNGVFFLSFAVGKRSESPHHHYDWYMPHFVTALIYLTPDAPQDAGTSFWRHRPTGLDAMPAPEDCERTTGKTFEELDAIVEADGGNPRKWTEIERVANRYNRVVLYPPHFFHSATRHFGGDVASGRIYQSFNFAVADRNRPVIGAKRNAAV